MRSPLHELSYIHTDDTYGKRWWITLLREGTSVAVFETARTEVMAAAYHLLDQSEDPDLTAATWAGLTCGPDWSLDGELGDGLVRTGEALAPKPG